MATEGKRIAQKLEESALIADVLVPKAAALINREFEAERKAVDELLRAAEDLGQFAPSKTPVRNILAFNRMMSELSAAAARLRKMRGEG